MTLELESNWPRSSEPQAVLLDWDEIWGRIGKPKGFVDSCPEVATAVMDYLEHDMMIPLEELEFKSVRTGKHGFFIHVWVEYNGTVFDTNEFRQVFDSLYASGTEDTEFMEEYQSRQKCGLHEELVAGDVRHYL